MVVAHPASPFFLNRIGLALAPTFNLRQCSDESCNLRSQAVAVPPDGKQPGTEFNYTPTPMAPSPSVPIPGSPIGRSQVAITTTSGGRLQLNGGYDFMTIGHFGQRASPQNRAIAVRFGISDEGVDAWEDVPASVIANVR